MDKQELPQSHVFGREGARDPGHNLSLSQGEDVEALPPENLSLFQNWSHSRNLTQRRCQLATGYLTTAYSIMATT